MSICCCPTCTKGCIATLRTARIWLASLCCFCLPSERVALDGETVGVLLFIYLFIFWLELGLVSGGSLQPAELDSIVRQYLTYECNLSSWHDSQSQIDFQIPRTVEEEQLKRKYQDLLLLYQEKHSESRHREGSRSLNQFCGTQSQLYYLILAYF